MFKSLIILFILSLSPGVLAEPFEECGKECQETVVSKYFDKLGRVYKKDSKVSHIEELFGSMSNEVQYEHLVYGANFSRTEWKEAFLRNHKSGAYKHELNLKIKVDNFIHGKGYVAVAYSYGVIEKSGSWSPKGDQDLMAVFSIVNGKITSVKEFW